MRILIFLLFAISTSLSAQQLVQSFSLINVVDNSTVTLESYQSNGLVILFTSNDCAYDTYYTARIKALIDTYKGKIQFLLINSYIEPTESIAKMKSASDLWAMGAPYLADKDQVAMESLSARKSPEAFLLKNNNGKYSVVYSGAIDDNPQVSAAVKDRYLRMAIDNLLAGQSIDVPNVRAVGCSIRKK